MRLVKDNLKFLKQYVSIAESSTVLGDKLKIEVTSGKVTYIQKSKDTTLVTSVPTTTNEEFVLIVQTKIFWDFLSTLKDTEELIITKEGISLGEDKSYNFDCYNIDFPKVENLLKEVELSKTDDSVFKFDFKDYEKLNLAMKYMGKDSIECVGLMKDKIVGTDKIQIYYSDAQVTLPKNYFISKNSAQLIMSQKGKQEAVRITMADKYYFFEVDGVLCIFDWKTYSVPDLFQPNIYSKFNQSDKVTVHRSDLGSVLNRMSFFVADNPSNRIFVSIQKENLLIENKDFNKSYEKIPLLQGNQDLIGCQFIVSCKNITSFLSNFSEDEISIFVNKDESQRSPIRFEDSKGVNKLVHSKLKED